MGRFKAEKMVVRKLNGIEIVFWDGWTIYVRESDCQRWTIFHRWFAERGSYSNGWQDFRRELMSQKRLTYLHCFEMAAKYGIASTTTDRELKFEGKEIEVKNG